MRALLSSALKGCLLIFAVEVQAQALPLEDVELNLRIRNLESGVQRDALVCGFRPLALNGVAYRWEVREQAEGSPLEGQPFCTTIAEIGPYQSKTQRFRWTALKPQESEPGEGWGENYPIVENPSDELLALARSFQRYPRKERLARIHQWMVENIVFNGIRTLPEGAEHALITRQGDCTEHMLLAAELLQRNGFTIRRVLGFSLFENMTRIESTSLHNWIEYQENGRWWVFDSSYRVLGEHAPRNYISLLNYQSPQQLDELPFWVMSASLKLHL